MSKTVCFVGNWSNYLLDIGTVTRRRRDLVLLIGFSVNQGLISEVIFNYVNRFVFDNKFLIVTVM